MSSKTKMEIHGPRRQVINALLSLERAVEVRSQIDRLSLVEIGQGFATALWLEAEQRTVITVHEPDNSDAVAAAVFACLAQRMGSFELAQDVDADDVVYEFDYAS